MTLAKKIYRLFKDEESFSLKDIETIIDDVPASTIRGRIYDNLGKLFKRVDRGVYVAISKDQKTTVAFVDGDGRDLSMFADNSFDAIITDHPWDDAKSNTGGSRKFVDSYDCFQYCTGDFAEKSRVLKPGGYLVEILPEENSNNYDYLYVIKKMALENGLQYYAKAPWTKGTFISNTGRKSKNSNDIMFFTKGKSRALRPDAKKIKATGDAHFMSGTAYMLPTAFDFQPPSVRSRVHQAEKPVELYEAIIEAVTLPGEVILDQFAGSCNLGVAAINTGRSAVLIDILRENIQSAIKRITDINICSQNTIFG